MEVLKEKSRREQMILLTSALLCLVQLFALLRQFSVMNLLWLAAIVFVTVLLFRGEQEKLLWDAFLALAAVSALGFFLGFSDGSYLVATDFYQTHATANRAAFVLPGLLCFAGVLGITALGGLQYASKFPAIGEKIRKAWYVPALLFAVAFALSLVLRALLWVSGSSCWEGFRRFAGLRTVFWCLFALALGMRAAGREAVVTRLAGAPDADAEVPAPPRYCSVAKLLFLSLITFGIWALVWVWRSTDALGRWEEKHPRKAWLETLCCLLLPCYFAYWLYRSARLGEKALCEDTPDTRFPLVCVLFGALLPPLGMCLLQDRFNELADRAEEGIEVELEILETATAAEPEAEKTPEAAEEVRAMDEVPGTAEEAQECAEEASGAAEETLKTAEEAEEAPEAAPEETEENAAEAEE